MLPENVLHGAIRERPPEAPAPERRSSYGLAGARGVQSRDRQTPQRDQEPQGTTQSDRANSKERLQQITVAFSGKQIGQCTGSCWRLDAGRPLPEVPRGYE